ncbi:MULTISPECIES: glycine-rich domain-containing protein [Streptomyces]|uniref:glycine-rich domain-containing protein n=1 Tax=Streptomyces TaxID=1883 RepID=UPI0021C7878A|nr:MULTISPECIES: hypothetical protein [Streptomyces]MCR8573084.1 hypothetical protein [Streptomyces sp. Isolate_219]WUB82344.1 hypothetical protein OG424_26040 [Streptomyces platensis]
MATALEVTAVQRYGRDLVAPELFDRLVDFCAEEYGLELSVAKRVMDQGLAFLDVMGSTGVGLSPSKQVDPAWHTFMLHSEEYTRWCMERYGRYIHHAPKSRYRDKATMVDVVGKIREAGYEVDESLWGLKADCNAPTCCGDGPCC